MVKRSFISGALKLYLRELPIPLLGQNYDRWISECSNSTDERKREAIDCILSSLPQSHRHNLHYILKFLQLVATQSSINKMTPANLSIVLAPNLMWNNIVDTSDPTAQHDLSQTNIVNDIVETLIEHVDFFFRGFGSGNMDFFKEVTLEKPKHLIKNKTNNSSGEDSEGQRTPVPKPRSSKTFPKGPPPPLAPRPADRSFIQRPASNNTNSSTTHL